MNPNIVIRIDVRESELIAKCQSLATQFPNVNFLNEQLPLGDIIINDGQEELIIIVLQQRIGEMTMQYESAIASLRADLTQLQDVLNIVNKDSIKKIEGESTSA